MTKNKINIGSSPSEITFLIQMMSIIEKEISPDAFKFEEGFIKFLNKKEEDIQEITIGIANTIKNIKSFINLSKNNECYFIPNDLQSEMFRETVHAAYWYTTQNVGRYNDTAFLKHFKYLQEQNII